MQMWFINSHRWQKKMTKSTPHSFQVEPIYWLSAHTPSHFTHSVFCFFFLFQVTLIWNLFLLPLIRSGGSGAKTIECTGTPAHFLASLSLFWHLFNSSRVWQWSNKFNEGKKWKPMVCTWWIMWNLIRRRNKKGLLWAFSDLFTFSTYLLLFPTCLRGGSRPSVAPEAVWSQRFPKCLLSPGISPVCQTKAHYKPCSADKSVQRCAAVWLHPQPQSNLSPIMPPSLLLSINQPSEKQ